MLLAPNHPHGYHDLNDDHDYRDHPDDSDDLDDNHQDEENCDPCDEGVVRKPKIQAYLCLKFMESVSYIYAFREEEGTLKQIKFNITGKEPPVRELV